MRERKEARGCARSGPRRDRAQAAWRDVLGAKAAEHGLSGRPMWAQPRADAPLPRRPAGPRQRAPRASADRTCDRQTPPAAGSRESFSRRVSQASEEGLTWWSSRRCERSDARREGDCRDPLTKKESRESHPVHSHHADHRAWAAEGRGTVRKGAFRPKGSRRPRPNGASRRQRRRPMPAAPAPVSPHFLPSFVARPWRGLSVWRFDHGAAEAFLRHVASGATGRKAALAGVYTVAAGSR